MGGMLRFKDEAEMRAALGKTHLRVRADTGSKAPAIQLQTPKEKKPREVSEIEELLASQISLVGNLPAPEREYHFLRGRAHRLDFAWPEYRINGMQFGVEVQGMVHRVKGRFSADLEKRALGLLQGWLILEVGGEQIRSGKAMEWIQELFTKAVKT